ncbi:MOSC domain-containing protein [Frigidibacter albus]|uniref:MOSC domain-containing protein n=1 Tax=Frigidibacter albus TaxID=1465486 RepID=A0A6L8VEW7_9RHOB|nr:MOSC domain-containing protein [Frigidibacter albus]MZQ88773.1 MOSC domain-containing protein [Frigidibacter albus]NBE30418.1 MOSC domain-containing protein [Frigidibacter albus]GGH50398.1 molybdenum cofactor biosysynthesis protein [Frigidibacter albus]
MTGTLAHIFRHPIKAHGREALASVLLSAGACLPWDRHWAVTHGRSKFDAEAPGWTPCSQFQRGARTPGLMAIEARFDEAAGAMVLTHPARPALEFRPESEGAALIDWLRPISPEGDFRPAALVSAPGRGMTDSDFPSVSLNSLSSNAALSQHMEVDLSIHRWRGNLWLEGFEPFAEMGWIGREVRIGAALLRVEERIGRCKATTANPATGEEDADTLAGLRALTGAQEFGVYAVVISPGRIAPGDKIEVL